MREFVVFLRKCPKTFDQDCRNKKRNVTDLQTGSNGPRTKMLAGVRIVAKFSLTCCTSMAHAEILRYGVKIISAYAKKCSMRRYRSFRCRGEEGGAKK